MLTAKQEIITRLLINESNWIEQKIDCFLSLQDERNDVTVGIQNALENLASITIFNGD